MYCAAYAFYCVYSSAAYVRMKYSILCKIERPPQSINSKKKRTEKRIRRRLEKKNWIIYCLMRTLTAYKPYNWWAHMYTLIYIFFTFWRRRKTRKRRWGVWVCAVNRLRNIQRQYWQFVLRGALRSVSIITTRNSQQSQRTKHMKWMLPIRTCKCSHSFDGQYTRGMAAKNEKQNYTLATFSPVHRIAHTLLCEWINNMKLQMLKINGHKNIFFASLIFITNKICGVQKYICIKLCCGSFILFQSFSLALAAFVDVGRFISLSHTVLRTTEFKLRNKFMMCAKCM